MDWWTFMNENEKVRNFHNGKTHLAFSVVSIFINCVICKSIPCHFYDMQFSFVFSPFVGDCHYFSIFKKHLISLPFFFLFNLLVTSAKTSLGHDKNHIWTPKLSTLTLVLGLVTSQGKNAIKTFIILPWWLQHNL